MKHLTQKQWLERAKYAAIVKGVSLTGNETKKELELLINWYMGLEDKAKRIPCHISYSIDRPADKTFYYRGKKYVVGFYHNGLITGVHPVDTPIVSVYERKIPKCVFVVSKAKGGGIAATTRPKDKGGGIGLPGGKMDDCGWEYHNPAHTGRRESKEEGWSVTGPLHFLVDQIVDGQLVRWMAHTREASPLTEYKEKHRGVEPIVVSPEELCSSGWGNDHPKIVKWVRKHC